MLRGMAALTTRSDVLPPLVTLLVAAMLGGVLATLLGPGGGRVAALTILVVIVLAVIVSCARRVCWRCNELLRGHCPNPLCHGVVQRSERARRGFVLCPTCGQQWPAISGIQFKTTSRQW